MSKFINLKRFQGSTLGYKILFTKNKIGIDITNYTVYCTLKINKEDSDANAVINKKITSHTDSGNGISIIEFIESDTKDLLGNYYHEISFKNSVDDTADVLFYGRMTIVKTTRTTRN